MHSHCACDSRPKALGNLNSTSFDEFIIEILSGRPLSHLLLFCLEATCLDYQFVWFQQMFVMVLCRFIPVEFSVSGYVPY